MASDNLGMWIFSIHEFAVNGYPWVPPLDPRATPINAPQSTSHVSAGKTKTSWLSCGIGPVSKPLATTLENPENDIDPSILVSSISRMSSCQVLSSSRTIESREGDSRCDWIGDHIFSWMRRYRRSGSVTTRRLMLSHSGLKMVPRVKKGWALSLFQCQS